MVRKNVGSFMVEFTVFVLIFALIAAFLGYTGYVIGKSKTVFAGVNTRAKGKSIVIDAGHGGYDGGAVGINGRLEKELNLELALKLESFFGLFGVDSIMTRTSDVSLGEDAPKGRMKTYDLARRLAIANDNPNALFLSIHMNKFPQEVCHGLQVWYSPNNDKSPRLAEIIKNNVKNYLQPDNTRECKKAGSSIYLLDRAENISVLVECGFVSNNEECERLCDDEYQKELAASLCLSVFDFYNNVG